MISDKEEKLVQIEINPAETTLEELLNLANIQKANVIAIKGETSEGEVQWGCVLTCGDNAGEAMRILEVSVSTIQANWMASRMN